MMLNKRSKAEELPLMGSAAITLQGRYLPPPQDKDGKLRVRTTASVEGSPEPLYNLWRDIEKAPTWQEGVTSVVRTGEKTFHWVMQSGDKKIEWDSEILADEPGKRIAWRAFAGDSENAGEVIFELSPGNRGTTVIVLQEFRMSKLTSAWETITGRNPKQAVIENLRHLKALAETGEIPRTQGQPHGPRGVTAKVKQSLYGEKIKTPAGARKVS
jgi:uncharacterized membrane protein